MKNLRDSRKIIDEVPEFVPTRQELIQLVKYWVEEVIKVDYDQFITGWFDGSQARLVILASHRINRIAGLLGKKAVDQSIDQVYAEFGEKQEKRHWDIFLNGTKEQRDAVQDEFREALNN